MVSAAREDTRLSIAVGRRDKTVLNMRKGTRAESGIVHAQRRKKLLRHELAQCLVGELLDDLACPVEPDAVVPALPGCEFQGAVPPFDGILEILLFAADVFRPPAKIWICESVAKSRGVGEQLSAENASQNAHRLNDRLCYPDRRGVLVGRE